MTQYMPYTGIGSRKTPQHVQVQMYRIAFGLYRRGLTLRSGGADGADTAFEKGTSNPLKEIYLPWIGFNDRYDQVPDLDDNTAKTIAKKHHPYWDNLKESTKLLMTRNTFQVLGAQCDSPSLFICCWTPDGDRSGGTGQALRIAESHHIPIFDLGNTHFNDVVEGIREIINDVIKDPSVS